MHSFTFALKALQPDGVERLSTNSSITAMTILRRSTAGRSVPGVLQPARSLCSRSRARPMSTRCGGLWRGWTGRRRNRRTSGSATRWRTCRQGAGLCAFRRRPHRVFGLPAFCLQQPASSSDVFHLHYTAIIAQDLRLIDENASFDFKLCLEDLARIRKLLFCQDVLERQNKAFLDSSTSAVVMGVRPRHGLGCCAPRSVNALSRRSGTLLQ